MQGAQILRNEAYIWVRRNDEGCRATQQMDFLRSHQDLKPTFFKSRGQLCRFLVFRDAVSSAVLPA